MAAPARHPSAAGARSAARIADPVRDVRSGAIVAALFFVGFLGWAAFARLDAAAYAPGTLVVAGQHQSVQHREGGVVAGIYVREGQRVVRGQILIRLAAADIRAQERALAAQSIRLLAHRAGLEAEQLGRPAITPPAEFSGLGAEDRAEAATALAMQRIELAARRAVLAAQRDALGQRAAQADEQGQGYARQATSSREQLRLIDEQIAALKPVADKGFVSQTRMRELSARAELEGQRGQNVASVAQTAAPREKNTIQALEAERSFHERTATDLRGVETSLGELLPKWAAARDQLARAEIHAPATGTVVGLAIFTPGGVIAPGQKLMDIVPELTPLRIQARISPDDIDDLAVGQRAMIRFTGLHERTLPNLEGRLTRLSADSFVDEKSGQSYFTGEVRIARSEVGRIQDVRGRDFALHAGMPVQVLVPLRKRSALDYALEPLLGSFWSSFREH